MMIYKLQMRKINFGEKYELSFFLLKLRILRRYFFDSIRFTVMPKWLMNDKKQEALTRKTEKANKEKAEKIAKAEDEKWRDDDDKARITKENRAAAKTAKAQAEAEKAKIKKELLAAEEKVRQVLR
jgi:hypothetical protein